MRNEENPRSAGRGSLLLALLALAGGAGGCSGDARSGGDAPPPATRSLDGTVILAGGGDPPSGAVLRLQLLDVTLPTEPGLPLTSMLLSDPGRAPVSFSLPYGEGVIQRLRVYGLEVRLEVEGREEWRTAVPIPVLSEEMPDPLVVELQPAAVAAWWDPAALDGQAEELDARRDALERRAGDGTRGGTGTRWTAWFEEGHPVVIEEESAPGREGSARAVYHLREGRVFRYAEDGRRVVADLSGEGRERASTLVLHLAPDGTVLRGARTEDGVGVDLVPGEVDRVLAHLPVLLQRVSGG